MENSRTFFQIQKNSYNISNLTRSWHGISHKVKVISHVHSFILPWNYHSHFKDDGIKIQRMNSLLWYKYKVAIHLAHYVKKWLSTDSWIEFSRQLQLAALIHSNNTETMTNENKTTTKIIRERERVEHWWVQSLMQNLISFCPSYIAIIGNFKITIQYILVFNAWYAQLYHFIKVSSNQFGRILAFRLFTSKA